LRQHGTLAPARAFIFWIWNTRSSLDCRLSFSNDELFVKYYHPRRKNLVFELKQIKSNISVKRYSFGELKGGFPKAQDFVNYRWYFYSEKFVIAFLYGEDAQEVEFEIQPNVIGFENFMNKLVKQTNLALEESKPSDSVGKAFVKSIIGDVIIDIID
jgi:hypothetical protein